MRCHWMNSYALKTVYKLLYASPAWRGFAISSDRPKRRIEAQSVSIKTLTPLRHSLLQAPITLFSKTFWLIFNMFFITSCQAELITHIAYKLLPRRHTAA